jgi:hypothetical protein
MYSLMVFLGTALFCCGLLFLQKPFFRFARNTTALLDAMLDHHSDEDTKHQNLIRRLGKMLPSFIFLILGLAICAVVAVLPLELWKRFRPEADYSSNWMPILAMVAGSVVLLIPGWIKEKSDYSPWAKLLHRLILDHRYISLLLFRLDKKLHRKKLKNLRSDFVVVTGLARAGTTALTTALYESGQFCSLTYRHMPFVLSPGFTSKKKRSAPLKERAHGDRVMVGVQSVEALEEPFFYFHQPHPYQGDSITPYELTPELNNQYLFYQRLVSASQISDRYLTKNNNSIIRLPQLLEQNSESKAIFMFRHPLDHASSLLSQHQRFIEQQEEDTFTLEYMNWLKHHEFGMGHKPFAWIDGPFESSYDKLSLSYWVEFWIYYYEHALTMLPHPQIQLVNYADFLSDPNRVRFQINSFLGENLDKEWPEFQPKPYQEDQLIDEELNQTALAVYSRLQQLTS